MSSWRRGPPSAPSTTCGALSSRPTSDWFAGVVLGNGRVPSSSWSASAAESRCGAGSSGPGAPVDVVAAGASVGAWRAEPCAAGTASSTRPTGSLPRLNSGRSATVLTNTPVPSSPADSRRGQPRGRRWPSKSALSSTR
ncbi:hypothetical protein ACWDBT_08135 [Streptomyces ardesiacus]